MNILCNAFSLKMLPEDTNITDIRCEVVSSFPKDCKSYVGHKDTANILGVEMYRADYKMSPEDTLYVAQYTGARLPEGATELPEGANFKFFKIVLL